MAKLHLDGGVTFEGTPEEIKAYTDLYAVKGAEKPEALELKAGDWVTIDLSKANNVRDDAKSYFHSTDLTAGKPYEVKATDDGKLYITDDNGDRRINPLNNEEAYTIVKQPEPAPKFKEGDIVVITGNTKMRHATQAEREQYEEAIKPKLKAGDWVTIDTRRYNLDITEGKAYEVLGDAGDLYFLDDAGDKRTGWFRDEAYEIVEEPSVFERIGRKEGEFKVGDIVRVIGDNVLSGENKDGDIGVVTSFSPWTESPQVRVSGRDSGNDGNGWFAPASKYELIAPVESRVDRSNRGDAS